MWLNQYSGSIVKRISRDWSKGIQSVNKVPRPNTYCHQIGHQISGCQFIKDSVNQGFAKYFQNLNIEFARIEDHGDFELEDLHHEKVKIPNRPKNRSGKTIEWK